MRTLLEMRNRSWQNVLSRLTCITFLVPNLFTISTQYPPMQSESRECRKIKNMTFQFLASTGKRTKSWAPLHRGVCGLHVWGETSCWGCDVGWWWKERSEDPIYASTFANHISDLAFTDCRVQCAAASNYDGVKSTYIKNFMWSQLQCNIRWYRKNAGVVLISISVLLSYFHLTSWTCIPEEKAFGQKSTKIDLFN